MPKQLSKFCWSRWGNGRTHPRSAEDAPSSMWIIRLRRAASSCESACGGHPEPRAAVHTTSLLAVERRFVIRSARMGTNASFTARKRSASTCSLPTASTPSVERILPTSGARSFGVRVEASARSDDTVSPAAPSTRFSQSNKAATSGNPSIMTWIAAISLALSLTLPAPSRWSAFASGTTANGRATSRRRLRNSLNELA